MNMESRAVIRQALERKIWRQGGDITWDLKLLLKELFANPQIHDRKKSRALDS